MPVSGGIYSAEQGICRLECKGCFRYRQICLHVCAYVCVWYDKGPDSFFLIFQVSLHVTQWWPSCSSVWVRGGGSRDWCSPTQSGCRYWMTNGSAFPDAKNGDRRQWAARTVTSCDHRVKRMRKPQKSAVDLIKLSSDYWKAEEGLHPHQGFGFSKRRGLCFVQVLLMQ